MKKFIFRFVAFPLLFVGTLIFLVFLTSTLVKSRGFKVWQTDSNNLVMGENKHYDILFTGASHARNLSRHKNHLLLEKILNASIANIGQGAASCGINEQYFYFKYFCEQHNSADKLVYLLSPPLLFSEKLPLASNTFNYEYFSIKFLTSYLKFDSENKKQRIFEYIRSKLTLKWILHVPKEEGANTVTLAKVDSAAVKAGIEEYYIMGKDTKRFSKSCAIIEDEIKFALANNTEVIFVIPPAVFGKWPGHEMTVEFARKMKEKYNTRYYDFSESIMDPKYYYDHHHLNTAGVVLFGEKYLKPVL
jgi:hypothetical protein